MNTCRSLSTGTGCLFVITVDLRGTVISSVFERKLGKVARCQLLFRGRKRFGIRLLMWGLWMRELWGNRRVRGFRVVLRLF